MRNGSVLPLLATAMAICMTTANAQDSARREVALFDPPVSTRTVPPKSSNDPVGEIRCTYYSEMMVQEVGTDSPAPNAATIVMGKAPPCDASHTANEILLRTAAYSLLGRKGQFLLFGATDPNGAEPFVVITISNGKIIFKDGKTEPGIQYLALEKGNLHLKFTRALNASCSIFKEGASCWMKLIGEGNIPRVMAQSQPPAQSCAAAYRRERASPEAPSMVVYDVDLTLDATGNSQVNSRGPVRCDIAP